MREAGEGAGTYRSLLERLDGWMAAARRRHPGVVPCTAGCTACCHGPFDITVSDAELVLEAVSRLEPERQAGVRRRAAALLARMRAMAPDWLPPYEIAALGDKRFDALTEALAGEPCPLLDDEGRCAIYAYRPMVCRLIGLPMRSPAGRTIENACPIQDRFPAYAGLAPQPFDLEEFELIELESLRAAAGRMLGDPERWQYETTLAALLCLAAPPPGPHSAA